MSKKSHKKEMTDNKIAKRDRNNKSKAIKRAQRSLKPNKRQRRLLEELNAADYSIESQQDLNGDNKIDDQRESEIQDDDNRIMKEIAQVDIEIAQVEEKQ